MITITAGNLRNNTLPLATVLDLFPSDALGGPTTATKSKHPVEIIVYGRDEPVRTDIPTDPKTGKARPMFRSRAWVADFFKRNNLAAGDEIAIEALRPRLFSLRPAAIEVNCNRQAVFSFQERRKAVSRPAPKRELTFIDLFAGIGGLRLGMEQAGLKCVFSSEWDKHSQKTYEAWYGERPHGDITQISPESIPDHDVLVGGFPCQPFSIAGVSKKNALGRAHGFLDATQGTLFFNVAKIIEVKRPRAFILENVKNLRSHDKGNTWRVIESTLRGLGYQTFAKIIDAAGWVPQHRERIFIVGFDTQRFGKEIAFDFPTPPAGRPPRFRDILEPRPPAKYTLTDHLWTYLQNYAKKHAAKGNGFGFGMTNLDGVSRTLSARYYKDGSEVLIPQKNGKNPRRLTPTEARRLMGFPDHLPIVVSDTQAYRQFGNAVVPKVAHAVGVELVNSLNELVEIRAESEIARVG